MTSDEIEPSASIRERLLKAALDCFLEDDYHQVSTRQIAARAGANVSMIRYYFGNKEGLYEEMIREVYAPVLAALDDQMLSSTSGIADYLKLYYRAMLERPEFPKLILKILALKQAPGRRFVEQLLERGRVQGARRINAFKANGEADPDLDPDMLRLCFVSMAITPLLLKDVYERQLGRPFDQAFLDPLAEFCGRVMAAALVSPGERP
jgi:AcrR family transcriptional regulator